LTLVLVTVNQNVQGQITPVNPSNTNPQQGPEEITIRI